MDKTKAKKSTYDKLIALAESKGGVIRVKDAAGAGIHSQYITNLVSRGIMEKITRGTYALLDGPFTEHQTAVEVCARVPRGVLCLLTALQFHGLTTQLPHQVWLAIPRSMQTPKFKGLPVRYIKYSQATYEKGIETYDIEGAKIKVYNVPKTITDCFKFRNTVGVDVAIEALREGWHDRRFQVAELTEYAELSRVWNVIRPYAETIMG